ncbi:MULTISPECIES: TetR/AcrR family transcriptional regulator [unclassified Streptomyces]|uniref:TetR/AcrR family transcriptional regulator n=1 Tax=unclassified Streptomyces TaxID=2593676 RepID=UPI00201118E1|nr:MULTISPECIES: TetR/AcrR family transcriptional regulator [unclassified Streptomyces]MDH6455824.1 AcrR family transcriptional regulator [Streptomyces sp. SAI-119]MDH6502247.1 AcrR family transcriptional regulator [Streptomyces sp. SAI-149]
MSEQQRSSKSRGYEMRKRAEDVERTRQRIVEAAVHLHGTAGPASTSVSAIAERAGVTRLTVYRHFPDETALFEACSGHWLSRQRSPRPEEWGALENPLERLTVGLADIYRFYRAGEQMLTLVIRDQHAVPESRRQAWEERTRQYVEVLARAWPQADDPVLRAVIGHAAAFSTWRSLCREQGLTDRDAVGVMVTLAEAVGTRT